jgi:spore coat protein U-like protein
MPVRIVAILFFMLLGAVPANAYSCSFSNTGIDFGNVDLTSGGFQSATGTFTADCTGNPGQTITICPNFNEGSGGIDPSGSPRFMTQGATQLRFDLFQTNGVGKQWGSYTWPYSGKPPTLSVTIGNNGFGSASQTIFGRLYNQQATLPPGTFTSMFGGANTQIDYGLGPSFKCNAAISGRAQNVPFLVRATNNSTCTVVATDLDFGIQNNLDAPIAATNLITATCTAGTVFEIGLSNGSSGATSPSQRKMTSTLNSQSVSYQIYRNAARTQVWGSTFGSDTVSSVSSGLPLIFTGYGLVPAQATPNSQVYTDNVVVVVTY